MHVLPSRQKAFPFGEGVGFADGRDYCLPPLGKVSALPTEEVCTVESVPPLGGVKRVEK